MSDLGDDPISDGGFSCRIATVPDISSALRFEADRYVQSNRAVLAGQCCNFSSGINSCFLLTYLKGVTIQLSRIQIQERFELKGSSWPVSRRLEMRIRCVPKDLHELYEKDKATFLFYYDQTRYDYLNQSLPSVDPDVAVQLCCLEIRRFFKDMPLSALDKKSNIEYLEKEFGLRNLLPESVIVSVKPKVIYRFFLSFLFRKSIKI